MSKQILAKMIGVKTDSEEDGWWLNKQSLCTILCLLNTQFGRKCNRIADTTIVALQCTYCSVMTMLLNTGKQQSATVFQLCPDTTMQCRNMQWNVQSATVQICKYENLQICKYVKMLYNYALQKCEVICTKICFLTVHCRNMQWNVQSEKQCKYFNTTGFCSSFINYRISNMQYAVQRS